MTLTCDSNEMNSIHINLKFFFFLAIYGSPQRVKNNPDESQVATLHIKKSSYALAGERGEGGAAGVRPHKRPDRFVFTY